MKGGTPEDAQSPKTRPDQNRTTPSFAEMCRTRAIPGVTGFSECLAKELSGCTYVVIFPGGKLCRHPNHLEIARRFPAD